MNLVKRLYELQILDSEINRLRLSVRDIENSLEENKQLTKVRNTYNELSNKVRDLKSRKKDIEFEIGELRTNVSHINVKLYSGSIKNPKELLDLEHDVSSIKGRLNAKEDVLIEIMQEEELLQGSLDSTRKELTNIEENWKIERIKLENEKNEISNDLNNLNGQRINLVADIDSESIKIYERIASKKGFAIVKVEQGRCQGCRLSLPMSDLQRARSGMIVQCSSCGMILYSG